ncbi:hypothetical protein JBO39_01455 [Serratia marcescens]|uniref:hypothetical protein n=1 Tax=Serratia marcescens TaxID=615 RepID=UPI00192CA0B6|nr:hypothetical protein [Serratia marcescens]MBL5819880.1 hypothetical protein [Serratia marcescens]
MTLTTTEELKHLASSDNANELTRRLARELLANREAQPVGFRYRHRDTASWLYNDWRWPDSVEAEQCQIEWLYTAPPAPAVPEVITAANSPEVFEIAAEVERLGLRGTYGAYAAGWNACRAAMLKGEGP